jgi:anti-sigma factor RsiW
MNCDDIAWILDERRIAALSPFERADLDAHIARCPDCAAQCRASESLGSFRAEVPPLPAALVERALELQQLRATAAVERRARRPVLVGSLLLLGVAASMLAPIPWSDSNAAEH